jgi:hypothetical protein
MSTIKPYDVIEDFITGQKVPNIGAEENRQQVERFLVESKGFEKTDIEIDPILEFMIGDEKVRSNIDLVVRVKEKRVMVFRCVAGALGSRHRETLSAARLLDSYQIPFAVVTDGKHAEILETVTGNLVAEGMAAIPSKQEAEKLVGSISFQPYPASKVERERIIYRSYEDMNVNVKRKLEGL